jgi:uncharacterized protein YjbI with pentapeptide repeats
VVAVLIVGIIAAACSGGSDEADEAGPCEIRPGVVCRDQDLRNVSMVAADLSGADFSGTDLRGSDLRDANLTGAKFVGAFLGGVNFTGATLKDADLTKANLFGTNFTDADLTGAIETDVYTCNVTQPNGALVAGDCPASGGGSVVTPEGPEPTGPPVIEYLRLDPPGRCLNDAAGQGVEVEYRTRNATGVTFSVDGVRIDGTSKVRGVKRLPFVCDAKPHTVGMRAFGRPGDPSAASTFTTALEETDAPTPDGG